MPSVADDAFIACAGLQPLDIQHVFEIKYARECNLLSKGVRCDECATKICAWKLLTKN